jgi:phosphatidylglycerophosphate synthase
MSKWKTFAIVVVGSVLHLGSICFLVAKGLNCEMRPSCVTPFDAMALKVLALPLGLIPIAMEHLFHKPVNLLVLLGPGVIAFVVLNSIAAVCLIWFGLVRPLAHWRSRRRQEV